ncbi:MAG TPA: E3 binding domain-containing protein, partial [Chitinophagaceae bacterium]|nr:E3 binding domain-containing protein [Chitinophagaceae bacterium]
MSLVDLVMPKMGESIMEATILKWTKKVGDSIAMDETLLEIATDKVDSEVPSTAAGTVAEILFKENDVVAVGKVIARIQTGGSTPTPPPAPAASTAATPVAPPVSTVPAAAPVSTPIATAPAGSNKFYSPLVLNIAASEGVSLPELEQIPGSGNEGRVTKKDILHYVSQRKSGISTAPVNTPAPVATSVPDPVASPASGQVVSGNVELIEMDRMRKMIADHMVKSKATSPH